MAMNEVKTLTTTLTEPNVIKNSDTPLLKEIIKIKTQNKLNNKVFSYLTNKIININTLNFNVKF
jgi:hypothetical protein